MLRAAKVKVEYADIAKMLAVVAVKGSGTSLLRREWIKALKVDCQTVLKIECHRGEVILLCISSSQCF